MIYRSPFRLSVHTEPPAPACPSEREMARAKAIRLLAAAEEAIVNNDRAQAIDILIAGVNDCSDEELIAMRPVVNLLNRLRREWEVEQNRRKNNGAEYAEILGALEV